MEKKHKLYSLIIIFIIILAGVGFTFLNLQPKESEDSRSDVLYIGLMVHLEGHKVNTLEGHNIYKTQILNYASILEEYKAKATWELKETIDSCIRYEDYYFKSLEEKGHGIGVHADLGGNHPPNYTYDNLVQDLSLRKTLLEKQGVTIRHASGVCSDLDWSKAVVDAGYKFVTGIVGRCCCSLDEEDRPSGFGDCTDPDVFHKIYPSDIEDRIHPWRANPDKWTECDSEGDLVIIPAACEGLAYLYKENSTEIGSASFTKEDIDGYFEALDEALLCMDESKINTFYASWSFGLSLDENLFREWLSQLNEYVQEGKVIWKTIPEMYDLYVEWENS